MDMNGYQAQAAAEPETPASGTAAVAEKKFGFWQFFLYMFLFAVPVVGLIITIAFSFIGGNATRAAFCRSALAWRLILAVIFLTVFLIFWFAVLPVIINDIENFGFDIQELKTLASEEGIAAVITKVADPQYVSETITQAFEEGNLDKIISDGTIDRVIAISGLNNIVKAIPEDMLTDENSEAVAAVNSTLSPYGYNFEELIELCKTDKAVSDECEDILSQAGGVAGAVAIYNESGIDAVVELFSEETLVEWGKRITERGL